MELKKLPKLKASNYSFNCPNGAHEFEDRGDQIACIYCAVPLSDPNTSLDKQILSIIDPPQSTTESWDQIVERQHMAIKALINQEIPNPFDYVEPCELECTSERHAYHQGQWDLATKLAQLKEGKNR